MSDFDAAVAKGGSLVAAWDDFDDARTTLALYAVGPKGAKQLAETSVPRAEQQERADELAARGVRIGYTVGNAPFVWVLEDDVTVWSATGIALQGNRATLRLAGEFVPAGDVRGVTSFVDADDRSHRGVQVEARGKRLVAVEEHDESAKQDPFYNADNLTIDALWVSYLGNDLANWLGVPFEDRVGSVDNASQLRIAKAAREIAEQTTAEVVHSIGVVEHVGEVKLRRATSSAGGEFLEVIVAPKGGAVASRWIRQGTREQIAATLRSVRLPRLVLDTASAILDQQRR